MNALKFVAVLLLLFGVLGLVYGGFSYLKSDHQTTIGPIKFSVQERERFNVPVWAGVAAISVGGVLLLLGSRKR